MLVDGDLCLLRDQRHGRIAVGSNESLAAAGQCLGECITVASGAYAAETELPQAGIALSRASRAST